MSKDEIIKEIREIYRLMVMDKDKYIKETVAWEKRHGFFPTMGRDEYYPYLCGAVRARLESLSEGV